MSRPSAIIGKQMNQWCKVIFLQKGYLRAPDPALGGKPYCVTFTRLLPDGNMSGALQETKAVPGSHAGREGPSAL